MLCKEYGITSLGVAMVYDVITAVNKRCIIILLIHRVPNLILFMYMHM